MLLKYLNRYNVDYTRLNSMDHEFYSIKEVAYIFSVSHITIRRAIRKGYIAAIRIGEGRKSPYRISKKTIDNIHNNLLSFKITKND